MMADIGNLALTNLKLPQLFLTAGFLSVMRDDVCFACGKRVRDGEISWKVLANFVLVSQVILFLYNKII